MTDLCIDVRKKRAKEFKEHLEEEHPSTKGKIELIDSKDDFLTAFAKKFIRR